MYWVITIMLMFHGTNVTLESEYTVKNFEDDWSCHKYAVSYTHLTLPTTD